MQKYCFFPNKANFSTEVVQAPSQKNGALSIAYADLSLVENEEKGVVRYQVGDISKLCRSSTCGRL